MNENILITEKSTDYELIDSGDGEKLERYGSVVLSRPDPQALWPKLKPDEWQKADAVFTHGKGQAGKWQFKNGLSKSLFDNWIITLEGLTFFLSLLPSKHIGVFPEQSVGWRWLEERIKHDTNIRISTNDMNGRGKISTLNLFGYTGGATLVCAKAGAEVVHVDSSEWAIEGAKENAKLSGLSEKPIRYILDDARKFVEREIKRGNKYDVIILDPPVYGKGSKKEVWNIEKDLSPLLLRLKQVLSDNPVAIVLNGYASGYSHITYAQMLSTITADLKGTISSGEFAIRENSGRFLPAGIFARWEQNK